MNESQIEVGDLVKCVGRTKNSQINDKVGIILSLEYIDSINVVAQVLIEDRIIRKNIKNIIKL